MYGVDVLVESRTSRMGVTQQQQQRNQNQRQQREKRLAYVSVPYVASINHQLKRAFIANGVDFHSKPGPKLGDILCSANKSRPDPRDKKGVYLQSCSCDPNKKYVGQTRVYFKTRMSQH